MEEALVKRVLPHSVEAEQSVIGSMLMDRDAIIAASETVTADDFYQRQYGVMFETMVELFNEGKPVDLVTLQDRLKEKDVPPEVCSLDFVRDILATVPTSANVRSYATIVHEKAVMRRLIKINEEIANSCYAGKDSLESILADTEKNIFSLLQSRNSGEFVPIRQVALNVLDKIEMATRSKSTVTGLPTGFIDLDYRLSGLQPSDLILIAARPSMGKTAFVLNIADYIGVRRQKTTMIFSLEMSKEQIVNRMLCCEAMIDANKMRTGKLEEDDWGKLAEAMSTLSDAPIYIDDNPGQSIMDIRAKCRRLKLEKGLGLIVIDYLQLMQGSSKRAGENRQQEVSDISRALKIMAKELEVPVITLSQLSRAPDARPDHRPVLSDLRESGAIEQDADIVMFLYRDDYYNPETEKKNISEVILAKHRGGSTGTVELVWLGQYTKFANKFNG